MQLIGPSVRPSGNSPPGRIRIPRFLAVCGLLLLIPFVARAASPEEAYLAARDKAIARLKPRDGAVGDALMKADDRARAALQKQLAKIVSPMAIAGVSADGRLNLATLIDGELDFGQLDGLAYAARDGKPRLIVTTPRLLERWIADHRTWWDHNNIPNGTEAVLRSEAFYTQAMSADASVSHFADVPVTKPADASFVTAMLAARRQDVGLTTPDNLLVAIARSDRLFVWSAPAGATITVMPPCVAIWDAAREKSDAAYEVYRTSELKDQAAFDTSTRLLDEGDVAYRSCFAERAPREPSFLALTRQAQELVDRVK